MKVEQLSCHSCYLQFKKTFRALLLADVKDGRRMFRSHMDVEEQVCWLKMCSHVEDFRGDESLTLKNSYVQIDGFGSAYVPRKLHIWMKVVTAGEKRIERFLDVRSRHPNVVNVSLLIRRLQR